MRDLLVLALVYGSLPLVIFRPFIGLAVFSWLAYMRPQDIAWDIGSHRLSMHVAVATLAGLALALGRERLLTLKARTALIIALAVWFEITSETAVMPGLSEKWSTQFVKVALICVLTTGIVRSRARFRALYLVIAFSLGLLGAKYGAFAIVNGGAEFLTGPGGFMQDRNGFALGLNMGLPLLVGVGLAERQIWLRSAGFAAAALSMLTILCTFSRGGLLTLGVVGALLVWRTRRPILAGLVLSIAFAGFLFVTPPSVERAYLNRASTITDFQEDDSARGRMRAWGVAWRVFLDHPVVGVGPRNFMVVYRRYDDAEHTRVAHSSYFQLLAESGLPGLAIFLALIATTLLQLQRLATARGDPWVAVHARMLQVSIVAYSVGSLLLDMAYFDLFYHLVAMSVCLEVVAQQPANVEISLETARLPELPWWRRPAGEGASR